METWRVLLSQYFTVPTRFKITQYQFFQASSTEPGVITAKQLHDSSTELKFNFLKKSSLSSSDITDKISSDVTNEKYNASWKNLEDVPSSNHENRKRYLEKTVIEPLFPGDPLFASKYFSSGVN